MFYKVFTFLLIFVFVGCSSKSDNKQAKKDTIKKVIHASIGRSRALKLVPGYRFSITGDFDGSGRLDTLTEHFVSSLDNKETNKFYDGIDYGDEVALTMKKKPVCFVSCSRKSVNILKISSDPQSCGLAYLKNEGDLNGDGTDEVSYVVDWADWSNLNTWNIVTYKNGKWHKLYSFAIWDWQLPDVPETYNQHGFAGRENKYVIKADTTEQKVLQNFLSFKGLVKKIAKNKLRIIYRNDNDGPSIDTLVVDLRKYHGYPIGQTK